MSLHIGETSPSACVQASRSARMRAVSSIQHLSPIELYPELYLAGVVQDIAIRCELAKGLTL